MLKLSPSRKGVGVLVKLAAGRWNLGEGGKRCEFLSEVHCGDELVWENGIAVFQENERAFFAPQQSV